MFFNRHFLLVSLLAGAVAVPYLSSSGQVQKLWGSLTGTGSSDAAAVAHESGASDAMATHGGVPPAVMPVEGQRRGADDATASSTQVEGNTQQTLEEVLRFDVTPTWIIERWPRVSTGLSELDLQGYRVALVTGTADSDLAGSLTYYFNKKNQVDRIIFHGTSGDPRALVAMVTSRYELKKQQSDDPSLTLFQRKSWGKTLSELRIRPAGVVRSDAPHARYEIELAIRRP
ncbi:MAG TPA: DUF6690 family protein [Pirellulales bacterium]|nr:DUF6690 family protein [Pirellulales bacterium]